MRASLALILIAGGGLFAYLVASGKFPQPAGISTSSGSSGSSNGPNDTSNAPPVGQSISDALLAAQRAQQRQSMNGGRQS